MKRKRFRRWGALLLFALLVAAVLIFLWQFTNFDTPQEYLSWESASVERGDDSSVPIDPLELPPALSEGEWLRYALTLPEARGDGMYLIFEVSGAELTLTLDGTELYRSVAPRPSGTFLLGQTTLPLPAGGGERLVMDVYLLPSPEPIGSPMLRLTDDPSHLRSTTAMAAHAAFPAGGAAVVLVLIGGLFLLEAANGRLRWRNVLLALPAAVLTVYSAAGLLTSAHQNPLLLLLRREEVLPVSIVAAVLWLLLHREKAFWWVMCRVVLFSLALLAGAAAVSAVRNGYLIRLLRDLLLELRMGIWFQLAYFLNLWLVAVSAGLAIWELCQSYLQAHARAQAVAQRERLMQENYQGIEERLRKSAALHHEFVHQLTAMNALLKAGDLNGISRLLRRWSADAQRTAQVRYAEDPVVNVILQDAARRAEEKQVTFRTTILLPKELPLPPEDLSTLLMNMLDNALEGVLSTPLGQERSILVQLRAVNGFLVVLVENTFDGKVVLGKDGSPQTTKPDPTVHGFGIPLMRAVAERYGSILEINFTEDRFTVQTALQLPKTT